MSGVNPWQGRWGRQRGQREARSRGRGQSPARAPRASSHRPPPSALPEPAARDARWSAARARGQPPLWDKNPTWIAKQAPPVLPSSSLLQYFRSSQQREHPNLVTFCRAAPPPPHCAPTFPHTPAVHPWSQTRRTSLARRPPLHPRRPARIFQPSPRLLQRVCFLFRECASRRARRRN